MITVPVSSHSHTPKQFKSPDSNAQNRESQRRSRARRRELIDDLSSQLEQYKRRGVEASLEMQKTARAVFAENQRLRALLHLHGVSEGKVLEYLSPPDAVTDDAATNHATRANHTCERNHRLSLEPARTRAATSAMVIAPASSQDFSSAMATRFVAIRADEHVDLQPIPNAVLPNPMQYPAVTGRSLDAAQLEPQRHPESQFQHPDYNSYRDLQQMQPQENGMGDDMFPPISDCFCPSGPPTPDDSDLRASSETSCDAAAAILVELHGQADATEARATLGCIETGSCSVKNTAIFRLIDELG